MPWLDWYEIIVSSYDYFKKLLMLLGSVCWVYLLTVACNWYFFAFSTTFFNCKCRWPPYAFRLSLPTNLVGLKNILEFHSLWLYKIPCLVFDPFTIICLPFSISPIHKVGDRCEVDPGAKRGVVKFVGRAESLAPGFWVGIQYDEPLGKHDGMYVNCCFIFLEFFQYSKMRYLAF